MGRHCPGLSAAGALALGIVPDGGPCDPAFGREAAGHGGGDLVERAAVKPGVDEGAQFRVALDPGLAPGAVLAAVFGGWRQVFNRGFNTPLKGVFKGAVRCSAGL